MDYELLEKILNFCSITDFENRRKAIMDHLFMEDSVVNYMQQLIDDSETENEKVNFTNHKKLIELYQLRGISVLDYFVSSCQIEVCFTDFCFRFDEIKARKNYLLRHIFLMDEKSIKYINSFIDRQKVADTYILKYRYFRNLLKACRILGINEAFEDFDTPEIKYISVFSALLRTIQITDLMTTAADYKEIVSSKYMRNVLHSYQAKFEKDQIMRNTLVGLWDSLSSFQAIETQVWFWEQI